MQQQVVLDPQQSYLRTRSVQRPFSQLPAENASSASTNWGGTVGVDYRKHDFLDATDRRGVDVVVDFIGGPYLDRNLRALAPGGRLIQVGTLQGGEGHLSLDLLLHNHLRLIGTVMKSRSFDEKLA